jgi:hypothetical protein
VAVSTYHAEVKHGDKYWLIYVPEVDRSTQARHVREIETMARDLVAVMEDVPTDSFELRIDMELPNGAREHVDVARMYRRKADEFNRLAAEESRTAARALAKDLPLRDVAEVLGVSHQRAHQLVNS